MTATNHALTGALIGLVTGNAWIAVPAALASHFVCDAIPHFDVPGATREKRIGSKLFLRVQIIFGAVMCGLLVGTLASFHPGHWLLASVCAFVATSPDLLSIPRFVSVRRGDKDPVHRWWLWQFHHRIQWFERPIGAVVEIAWFAGVMVLLAQFVR